MLNIQINALGNFLKKINNFAFFRRIKLQMAQFCCVEFIHEYAVSITTRTDSSCFDNSFGKAMMHLSIHFFLLTKWHHQLPTIAIWIKFHQSRQQKQLNEHKRRSNRNKKKMTKYSCTWTWKCNIVYVHHKYFIYLYNVVTHMLIHLKLEYIFYGTCNRSDVPSHQAHKQAGTHTDRQNTFNTCL